MRDHADDPHISLLAARPSARPRSIGRTALIGAAATALLIAGGVGLRYGAPIPADAHRVARAEVPIEVRGQGVLDADRRSLLGATLQGRLREIRARRGDVTSAGAILATLEDADQSHDLAVARHQAQSAAAQLDEARAQQMREQATLSRAARELQRQQTLSARGVASDGALDIAEAEHRVAEAAVVEATARLERLDAERAAAERTVALRAEALAQTRILAPFDGVIIAQHREVGDVAAPGEPILELVDPASLVLGVRLDESHMAEIAPGQPASVVFASARDRPYPARVLRIHRQVDDETREVTVDLALEDLPRNWALGQRGMAALTVAAAPDAIAIPSRFVTRRDGEVGVWTLENGRARWRPLTLGRASRAQVIVTAGLAEGDVVLAPEDLFARARVEIGR